MAKLPQQPDRDRLNDIEPDLINIESDLTLYRIYSRGGHYPVHWNQFRYFGPVSRFDHQIRDDEHLPIAQSLGSFYAATDIPTAFAEVFQRNRRRINRFRQDPWLVAFTLKTPVRLLNLTDTFCVRAGASMKLVSGPFRYSQNWARGFYDAYPDVDGIYYPSSLTNRPSLYLYERADTDDRFNKPVLFHRALSDPIMLSTVKLVAEDIGYGVV